jgi:hypothetical protein
MGLDDPLPDNPKPEYFMDLKFPLFLRLRARECYDPLHLDKRWDVSVSFRLMITTMALVWNIVSQSDVVPQSYSPHAQAAIQDGRVLQQKV